MIAGSISFSENGNPVSDMRFFSNMAPSGTMFCPVVYDCFSGGYFLNSNLPYTSSDFYCYDQASGLVVLLSGAIYNKGEIKRLPWIPGILTDPELIAILFMREGPDFVKRLNGDFIIFILQMSMKRSYLFRDHLGIRPMAWIIDNSTLWFSSFINGLACAFSVRQSIRSDYLLRLFKFIDYTKTPNTRVAKLLPGHYLCFSEKEIRMVKYWEPEKIMADRTLKFDRMLADLKLIITDAVSIRCDNRFCAGAHVSGGLDSGIISALVRKEYMKQPDFYGFSWSPDSYDPGNVKYDERQLVRISCQKTDIKPVFSDMNLSDFIQSVSRFYYNNGYFSEDITSTQAAKLKTNLIFSGWGGDEFISTGERGIDIDLLVEFKLRMFFRRNKISEPKRFLQNILVYVLYPLLGIPDIRTSKSIRTNCRYLKKPYSHKNRDILRKFYFNTTRRKLHLSYLDFYHIQERCESWSVNGYCKGVEYRYPLLDWRIIEYMLKVPSELICQTSLFRPILRLIGTGIIPDEIQSNLCKNDPVYWSYMDTLFTDAAIHFMKEFREFSADPDLHFINFDLLEKDLSFYFSQPDFKHTRILIKTVLCIEAIHSFTVEYNKNS